MSGSRQVWAGWRCEGEMPPAELERGTACRLALGVLLEKFASSVLSWLLLHSLSENAYPRMHGGPPSQVRVARGGCITLPYLTTDSWRDIVRSLQWYTLPMSSTCTSRAV